MRRDARAQRRHVARAVRMHAVRQKDDEHARRRIDPDRRAGEPGVAERAERQQLAAIGRVGRVDVPAEAADVGLARRASPATSSARRSAATARARPPIAPPLSSMRQKIARSAAVLNSPAWPATPPIRRAVGSWTTPRSIVACGPSQGQPNGVHGSVGAIARRTRRRRLEHRLAHAERPEDPRLHELVERLLATPGDDLGEQEEVDVAVDEPPARRRVGTSSVARRIASSCPVHGVRQVDVGPQAGHVRQQIAHRDARLAVACELGNERRDRVGEADACRPPPASSPRASSRRPSSATRGRRSCRASSASARRRQTRGARRPSGRPRRRRGRPALRHPVVFCWR